MRFPAFQILLVLFVALKPICLLLLTFELSLASGFPVFSMVKEIIGLFGGFDFYSFPDGSPVSTHQKLKGGPALVVSMGYVVLKGSRALCPSIHHLPLHVHRPSIHPPTASLSLQYSRFCCNAKHTFLKPQCSEKSCSQTQSLWGKHG